MASGGCVTVAPAATARAMNPAMSSVSKTSTHAPGGGTGTPV
jgi:hypothetical protein